MRLIDANALLRKARLMEESDGNGIYCLTPAVSVFAIEDATTVDAVEVVHGQWEKHPTVYGFVRCSVCHNCNIYDDWAGGKRWSFCPECGADLREKKDEEDK